MINRRIDEFFKNKLGNGEIQPDISVNEKFLAQLAKRRTGFIWWKVAASVAILGIATWVFLSPNEMPKTTEIVKSVETEATSTSIALIQTDKIDNLTQITKVAPEVKIQEKVPQITEEVEPELEMVASVQLAVNNAQIPKEKMNENFVTEQKIDDDRVIPTPEELPDLSNELKVASSEKIVNVKKLPVVRITYISGNKKRQKQMTEAIAKTDTSKVSPLNRIFIGAISLADGSLIAGLRDTKEDFFNRNND